MQNVLRSALRFAGCLCLLMALASASSAGDWRSFNAADISGIEVAEVGDFTYTVALGNDAKVAIGNVLYDVVAVKAFYAVGKADGTDVLVGNTPPSSTNGWTWDGNKQDAVGWVSQGAGNDITPGIGGKTFAFPQLGLDSTLWGFHLIYRDGAGVNTSYWAKDVDPTSPVPEPSSLLALIGSLGGMVGLRRLRRK